MKNHKAMSHLSLRFSFLNDIGFLSTTLILLRMRIYMVIAMLVPSCVEKFLTTLLELIRLYPRIDFNVPLLAN